MLADADSRAPRHRPIGKLARWMWADDKLARLQELGPRAVDVRRLVNAARPYRDLARVVEEDWQLLPPATLVLREGLRLAWHAQKVAEPEHEGDGGQRDAHDTDDTAIVRDLAVRFGRPEWSDAIVPALAGPNNGTSAPSAARKGYRLGVRLLSGVLAGLAVPTRASVVGSRILRCGTGAVLATALIGTGVYYAVRPPNLARGARVTASSAWSTERSPEQLVNGTVETDYGFATRVERDANVVVDLGAAANLSSIAVRGRPDGYIAPGYPLVLAVSADGVTYRTVGTRTTPIRGRDAWHAEVEGDARFVRLSVTGFGQLNLTEIEVRGRRKSP